jgi:hypothetical protein
MKKLSEILRGAYAHLWDGESDFIMTTKSIKSPGICGAVYLTKEAGHREVCDFIEHELDALCKELSIPEVTFYPSIFRTLGVPEEIATDSWRQLRRREWLTMLISKLERQGQ